MRLDSRCSTKPGNETLQCHSSTNAVYIPGTLEKGNVCMYL